MLAHPPQVQLPPAPACLRPPQRVDERGRLAPEPGGAGGDGGHLLAQLGSGPDPLAVEPVQLALDALELVTQRLDQGLDREGPTGQLAVTGADAGLGELGRGEAVAQRGSPGGPDEQAQAEADEQHGDEREHQREQVHEAHLGTGV